MITYLVKFDAHAADFGTITVDEQMIDPNSYVKEATENSEYVFRIEVANGYEVETVRANDMELVSDGSPDKYRIAAVTEDTVIAVVYREVPQEAENAVQHVVSFQTGEGASVTVDGADATNGTAMAKDGKILFTVAAQEGFSVTEVLVDGTIPARTTGNPNEYIIEGIQTDATVVTINTASAQTEETETEETEMPVTENLVTFQSAEGATVIVDGRDVTNGTATAKNGTLVFTAAPAEGFRISEVLVDGEVPARTTGNTGEYIIEGIMTDDTVVIVNTAPIEEKEDEETQEQEKPAQTMTVTASDGATVIITAPQGALPEGAQVIAQVISSAAIENAVADAVAAEGKALVDYKAYDITIIDGAGNVIQPDASVQVTINNAGVAGEKTAVYHVEGASADKVAEVPGGDYAAFAAAHFSIYVVAGSQTEQPEVDEVLVTYNMIYDNGVAVVPPDTVAYDLTKEGITTKYAVVPQEGYTIAMSVEGEGAEHFRYENGKVIGSFTASGSYEVVLTYTPNEIRYTVTHYYQNVDRTDYVADPVKDELTGKVNTMTAAQERSREGFTVQHIEQDKIPQNAKDDQINIEVYYDRNECLLTYNTMGGSYIESEILAYGAEVDLPGRLDPNAPVREGYHFTGWYLNEACTEPVQNNTIEVTGETTVYAGWEGDEVNYTVVYMAENADDENYSYINSKTFQAVAGTTVQVNSRTHGLTTRDYKDIAHFEFDSEKATSGEIAADGSTVLLAYYNRKVYTLTFKADALVCTTPEHKHISPNRLNTCYKLTCTKLHWHSVAGGCYKEICGLQEHQHSAQGCYDEVTQTITAKYEQDISELWNEAVGPGTPLEGNNWAWDESKSTAFQTTMPGEKKELTPRNNGNTRHELHYYIEDPNGTIQYREKTFRLYTDVILNVSSGSYPTFNEEFFEIDGYERFGSSIEEWANGSGPTNGSWDAEESFYYTRATYNLYLKNGDSESTLKVPYLSDISGYLTPPTQSPIPEGTFAGWYLDPEFTTPFTGTTMPKGLSLYAKWEPKSLTVMFMSDDEAYDTQNVIYGNTAKQPVRPPWKEEFIFEGWYTSADGDVKYDFNAPVTEDRVIYAKWTPITDTVYRVDYVTEKGVAIAQSKNGTGTVGEVIQEFAVKPQGNYSDYTVDEAEKTLKLTANAEENVIQFIYTRVRELHYTIEYRDMDTNSLIHSQENIPSDANQLVVHPSQEDLDALDNKGYELVDHYKNVELTVDGDNIVVLRCKKGEYTITYTGDENAAYPDGANPTSYTYGDIIALHNPQKPGYKFTGWKFVSKGGETSGTVHDGMNTLIEAGSHGNLDFEATWRAIAYTVHYDANGGTPTPASKTNVTWNQGALLPLETPVRNGYKLTGWTYNGTAVTADHTYASLAGTDGVMSITLTAQWTEDFDAKVRVTYEADPSTGGSVSKSGEDITIVSAQGLTGAVASETVNGYRFEGWYQGTTLVTKNLVLSRQDALSKLNTAEDGTYTATAFIAKFAYDEAQEVTISYESSNKDWGTVDPGSEKIQIVPGNPDASIKGSAATALTGYKFVGWYKGNTPVSAAAQLDAKSIKDALNKDANGNYAATTFTAKFDYDETALATVTYVSEDAEKGTVDNGSDTIQIRTGEPLSGSKAAATAGYQFDGWYKGNDKIADSAVLSAADAKKALDINEDGTYKDTTFTAKFVIDETQTADVFYVSEDAEKGTVSVEKETIQIVTGEPLEGSKATAKAGYRFTGWKKSVDGSDLVVAEQATLDGTTAKNNLNTLNDRYTTTTFIATFTEQDNVTLTYAVNPTEGGTVTNSPESLAPATGQSQGSTATAAPGYKFTGWTANGEEAGAELVLTSEHVDAVAKKTGIYEATTFTANFAIDEDQTVEVTYEADPTEGGTVTNSSDTIQIVTADGLTGSKAEAAEGYKFIGWYKGNQFVTAEAELNVETALKFLEKPNGKTYVTTVFTARFEIDPTQTKELSATVDYMLAQVLQPEDHVELKETVQVLQPDTLSTAGVTGKSYPGWKLDKITVNGETVETLPSEVDDKAKVIYHYIADFVDLDAAGFEEFYSGQTYQVSVTGTLEGDVIRFYKTDAQTQETAGAGEEIPNSFVNVSDSTAVLVEVTRGSNEQTWTKTVNAAVKPVEVELTADSGQKVYDGTPLEVSTYKITAGAFVADEGLEIVTIEGSQTYVGSSAAEITAYTFKKGTLEENYRIICKPGTLTVTEEGADPDDIMTKTHEGKTYGLGDVITFTIKVKNIYDKSCDITINEQQGVKITGESKFTAVKPGEEVSTTAVYTVTEADLLVGRFTNTVTASIDENTHTATDTTDTFEDPKSHLTVDKKTTSTPKDGVVYTPGETITYAVTAVNDGNLTLTDVKVVDELTGDVWKIKSLAPGESQTFEAEYLVTEADMENGTVKNVATAVVEKPDPEHPGTIIVPGNTEDPIVTEHASLWLEKTVDSEKDSYEVGDTIRYTIHVVNNGNVTIRDIEVRDPLTGDTWTIEALAPQEKQEFHTTYKVTEEDAKKGSVTNTAEVIGTDPGDNEIKTDGSVTVRVVPKPLKAEMSKDDMPKGGVPKTGDETAVMQWLLLMAIAAGTVLTGTLLRRKRKA